MSAHNSAGDLITLAAFISCLFGGRPLLKRNYGKHSDRKDK